MCYGPILQKIASKKEANEKVPFIKISNDFNKMHDVTKN